VCDQAVSLKPMNAKGKKCAHRVRTDAKGGEEGEETAANDDPFESLGFSSAGQKVAGCLSERIRRAHRCA
jgi:hypothetical protein